MLKPSNFMVLFYLIKDPIEEPLDYKIYLHSSGSHWSQTFVTTSSMITDYQFHKLEAPYETQCHKYEPNDSQSNCLNHCYLQQYVKHLGCRPLDDPLAVLSLKESAYKPNIKHCPLRFQKEHADSIKNISYICLAQCPGSCYSELFIAHSLTLDVIDQTRYGSPTIKLKYAQQSTNKIVYYPKLDFTNLIISLINVINFWHGTTILQLIRGPFSYISKIIANYLTKIKWLILIDQFLIFLNRHNCINATIVCSKVFYIKVENLIRKYVSKYIFILITDMLLIYMIFDAIISYLHFDTIKQIDCVQDDIDLPAFTFSFSFGNELRDRQEMKKLHECFSLPKITKSHEIYNLRMDDYTNRQVKCWMMGRILNPNTIFHHNNFNMSLDQFWINRKNFSIINEINSISIDTKDHKYVVKSISILVDNLNLPMSNKGKLTLFQFSQREKVSHCKSLLK